MTQRAPTFTPPSDAVISQLASRFCEASAAAANDPTLASWDIVHGVAQFLRAAAFLCADAMNRQAREIDSAA